MTALILQRPHNGWAGIRLDFAPSHDDYHATVLAQPFLQVGHEAKV